MTKRTKTKTNRNMKCKQLKSKNEKQIIELLFIFI